MECEDEWEYRDMWIIIPQYPAPIMRKLMKKNIFFVQTNKRARYFRELWHNEHAQRPVGNGLSTTWGLGYARQSCLTRAASYHYLEYPRHSCLTYATSYSITDKEEGPPEYENQTEDDLIVDLKEAPKELEEGGQATVDELKERNLGTEEDPKPTFISANLPHDKAEELKMLLL